jgi:hypothetical protein
MKRSELKQIIKEVNQELTEGFKLKMPKTADEASSQAMDWQNDFKNKSYSWEDVILAGEHFAKVAKKFGLTDEFEENGII